MATQTSNYSLTKAAYGERADIATYNTNMDYIDAIMADNRRIGIPMYDPTSQTPCNKGAIRGHEDSQRRIKCYECQEDNVTGPWDSTKWEQKSLGQIIEEVRENAGTDVEANPSGTATEALEKLRVDSTIYAIPEDVVSKEAEGNPIEISDGANAPLVKCVSAITGSQDLHGYDKPWVGGAGKNKFTFTATSNTINGITFTVNSDGTIKANGTASDLTDFFLIGSNSATGTINCDANINYIVSGGVSGSAYIRFIGFGVSSFNVGASDAEFSPTSQAGKIFIRIASGTVLTDVLFKPMLRLSTESDPTFAPYSNICPITAYTEGEIEVRGKNIFDTDDKTVTDRGVTFTASNNVLSCSGTVSSGYPNLRFPFNSPLTEGTYTISCLDSDGGKSYPTIRIRFSDDTYIDGVNLSAPYTFSVPSTKVAEAIQLSTSTNLQYDFTMSNIQIEKGSTATAYEPYTSTTHTTTFPSAIYRGSEDVVNGEVTSTWGSYTFTGSERWTQQGSVDKYYSTAYLVAETAKLPATNTDAVQLDTPIGIFTEPYTGLESKTYSMCISRDGRIGITADIYADISMLTGMTIWFELATPTTSSVTPTNLPIKSLSGYNHIESSTGDMEVEYITKGYQPLLDIFKRLIVANPSEPATDTLSALKVDDTVYSLPSGGGISSLAQSVNSITISGGVTA